MNKKLSRDIEVYLKNKKAGVQTYAPVTDDELTALYVIVRQLIAAKYAEDPDGDLPVEVALNDRTRFHRIHFEPIPYTHKHTKPDSIEAHEEELEAALLNMAVAHDQVNIAHRGLRYARHAAGKNKG